jgi:UDP-glucose 4-epimerase
VWVVGAGGLLGSHVARRLSESSAAVALWDGAPSLSWKDREALFGEIARGAASFADAIARGSHPSWALHWAAGAGVVATAVADLRAETASLEYILERLGAELDRARVAVPGSVFLASSAGGVYAGTTDSPATESSAVSPLSDYGREKLRQEQLCTAWAAGRGASCLVGRIANLYGPGQNLRKAQGLISYLARNLILNQPAHVYVPLDTVRDYLHADDCARAIAASMAVLSDETKRRGPIQLVKVFASEQPASVAVVLGIFSRLARRKPRIIQATRPEAKLQPRCLSFRSEVWPGLAPARIPLPVGIRQTYEDMLEQFRRGTLGALAA